MLLLLSVLVALYLDELWPIFLISSFSFGWLLIYCKEGLADLKPLIGWPNLISCFRFIGIGFSILLIRQEHVWELAIILTFLVLLDLLDGYLARKLNQASKVGLHLDMEVDAFFVVLMCAYLYLYRTVGIWILIPGLLRYIYVLYMRLFPKEGFAESKQRYASFFAGLFFAALLIAIVINEPFLTYLLASTSLLIIFSFGISFIQYFKWSAQ